MATLLEGYNLALGLVGAKGKLTDVLDTKREGEVCRTHYEAARNEVFSAAFWPSLERTARLNLISERDPDVDWETGDPHPHWGYAYATPPQMLRPRYFTEYEPFELRAITSATGTGSTMAIQTNTTKPIMVYTQIEANPALWEPLLYSFVFTHLATKIGAALNVPRHLRLDVRDQAAGMASSALVVGAQTNQPFPLDHTPDFILARDGGFATMPTQRYIFPVERLSYGQTIAR